MCSLNVPFFLLLFQLLEHLVLLFILHQILFEPEVVLRFDDRRPIILIGLACLYQVEFSIDVAYEFCVGHLVHLINLAVDDPQALLVIPSHALQHLQPLALRR